MTTFQSPLKATLFPIENHKLPLAPHLAQGESKESHMLSFSNTGVTDFHTGQTDTRDLIKHVPRVFLLGLTNL